MKLVLCFLYSLYASFDNKWFMNRHPQFPVIPMLLKSWFSMSAGYLCHKPLLSWMWYSPKEITMISLLFILLYHLHPKTRKFDFINDCKILPQSLAIFINEFGFGMLAGLQVIPLSGLLLFSVLNQWFLFASCHVPVQSKWVSILLIVMMLMMN